MQYITVEQNRALHSLINQLGIAEQKANMVFNATDGRSSSSKELTQKEAQAIINNLNAQKAQRDNPELKKMRGKITFLLVQLGYVQNQKLDTKRAENYIKNIGSNNPRQVGTFDLNKSELQAIITQLNLRLSKQNVSTINQTTAANQAKP